MRLRRIREVLHEMFLTLQRFIGVCRLESSAIHKDLSAYPGASLMRSMLDLLLASIARLSKAVKRLYRHRDDDDGFEDSARILERSSIRWVVLDSELWARCRKANRT